MEGAREPATEGDPTFQGLLDEEADLLRALRELPDQYREVIHLHYFEELPLREIARMTGVSEAAATLFRSTACRPGAPGARPARPGRRRRRPAEQRHRAPARGPADQEARTMTAVEVFIDAAGTPP